MLSICTSSLRSCIPLEKCNPWILRRALYSNWRLAISSSRLSRLIPSSSTNDSSSSSSSSTPLDYDPSRDLLGLEEDVPPLQSNVVRGLAEPRSWFGPNGQYIRELPCPCCRGRGYTPCADCGIERPRIDCSKCNGKGIQTCRQCLGDCVIWEESIDERPWEKARSSSPLKVKEDDEVDKLEIKVDVSRKSKRKYQSPSPEVSQKISRSLRSLNAKTGLFSKRMKIIHRNPKLHAQRVAAIKKTKGTPEARKRASETMKAFFSNPDNRQKRSIAMKGVKFYCSNCKQEGHRSHYCPMLRELSGPIKLTCRLCREKGHNRRTCGRSKSSREAERSQDHGSSRRCKACGESGHNRGTCPKATNNKELISLSSLQNSSSLSPNKKSYSCGSCMEKGHNVRTCPKRVT